MHLCIIKLDVYIMYKHNATEHFYDPNTAYYLATLGLGKLHVAHFSFSGGTVKEHIYM